MGQMPERVPGPVYGGSQKMHVAVEKPQDSWTLWKHYLMEHVLPALTLLLITALMIVLLLLVVTAVADIDQRLQAGGVGRHAWQVWAAGQGVDSNWVSHPEGGMPSAIMGECDPQIDGPADAWVAIEPPQP
jgi:hypothetical protein